MRSVLPSLGLISLLVASGCGDATPGLADAGEVPDTGEVVDTAEIPDTGEVVDTPLVSDTAEAVDTSEALDAGEAFDAGEALDAGAEDAPGVDASVPRDLGPPRMDAGPPRMDAGSPRVDAGTPRRDSGPPEPTEVERTYRVLHWNIAGGKENDCVPGLITRAVVRYVREHEVDFVGLNEVCPSQFAAIEEALRDHWRLGPRFDFAAFVGDGTDRIVGNAIYSRLGTQNVTRQMVGSDQYGARNLLCAQVAALPHLRFCSTHLTPGDATARVQLGRVIDRLESWWTERRDTVLLTGDLNLTPNDPGLNALYTDAANTRNNPDNRGRYHELDDADPAHCPGYGERSVPNTTGGPCGAGGKIDFIFARENRIVDDAYAGDTFDIPTDCTGVCSDHRAVFGRVRVRVLDN